jgi:phage terminase large subunit-like protein
MLQLPARFTPALTEDFESDGDLLIQICETFMATKEDGDKPIVFDEWQRWLLRHMLERYPENHPTAELAGRLRYRQIVVSLGRQNGKSNLAQALAIYGLLMHESGPTVIGLASSVDQARIIYERVLFSIRSNPWLAKRFKKATEHRGIHLADGSGTYHVKAARGRAVQGITVSLGIVDELHIIPDELYSSLTLGASTRKDGLIVGITTAGNEDSTTLLDLYKTGERAILGENERFGFFVWEAPANCELLDPVAIMAANPSVAAGRIGLESVISDMKTIPEHEARRYRLNQFVSGTRESWLPAEFFLRAAGEGIKDIHECILGVDLTKNFAHATIAAAKRDGNHFYTELVASLTAPTEEQLAEFIYELYKKSGASAVTLDDRYAHALKRRLERLGMEVWPLWAKEINTACATVYQMFANQRVTHANDPLLVMQNPRGMTRYYGESWQISRKESLGDIDSILATVFALYVASARQESGIGVF